MYFKKNVLNLLEIDLQKRLLSAGTCECNRLCPLKIACGNGAYVLAPITVFIVLEDSVTLPGGIKKIKK